VKEALDRRVKIFGIRRDFDLKKLSPEEARTRLDPLVRQDVAWALASGELDQRIAPLKQRIAQLRGAQQDPSALEFLAEQRIEALLDNTKAAQRVYEVKTLEQNLRRLRGEDKERAKRWLSIYRIIVSCHQGELTLEAAQTQLLPLLQQELQRQEQAGEFDRLIGELEQEVAGLEQFKENPERWVQHRVDELLALPPRGQPIRGEP